MAQSFDNKKLHLLFEQVDHSAMEKLSTRRGTNGGSGGMASQSADCQKHLREDSKPDVCCFQSRLPA
jgi:hypothetical protein